MNDFSCLQSKAFENRFTESLKLEDDIFMYIDTTKMDMVYIIHIDIIEKIENRWYTNMNNS